MATPRKAVAKKVTTMNARKFSCLPIIEKTKLCRPDLRPFEETYIPIDPGKCGIYCKVCMILEPIDIHEWEIQPELSAQLTEISTQLKNVQKEIAALKGKVR